MIRLYLISSLAAISFFSYAQYRGMSLFSGAGAAQQLAKSGTGAGSSGFSRSSSISHK